MPKINNKHVSKLAQNCNYNIKDLKLHLISYGTGQYKVLLSLFTFIMLVSAFILPLTFVYSFFVFLDSNPLRGAGDEGMSLFDAWPWTLCVPLSLRMQVHSLDVKRKIKIHINPTKKRNPTTQSWYINIFILPPSLKDHLKTIIISKMLWVLQEFGYAEQMWSPLGPVQQAVHFCKIIELFINF